MIVEDDEVLATGMVSIPQQGGDDITQVGNGLEADASLGQGVYDLVILDLGLPGPDGFEVLRRARARCGRGPCQGPRPRVRWLAITQVIAIVLTGVVCDPLILRQVSAVHDWVLIDGAQ